MGNNPLDLDDRSRPKTGVLFSLLNESDGSIRMIVDELRRTSEDWKRWETFNFVTHVRYPAEKLLDYDFTDEQLAEIGRAFLVTLVSRTKAEGAKR